MIKYKELNAYIVYAIALFLIIGGLLTLVNATKQAAYLVIIANLFLLATKDNPFINSNRKNPHAWPTFLKTCSVIGGALILASFNRKWLNIFIKKLISKFHYFTNPRNRSDSSPIPPTAPTGQWSYCSRFAFFLKGWKGAILAYLRFGGLGLFRRFCLRLFLRWTSQFYLRKDASLVGSSTLYHVRKRNLLFKKYWLLNKSDAIEFKSATEARNGSSEAFFNISWI